MSEVALAPRIPAADKRALPQITAFVLGFLFALASIEWSAPTVTLEVARGTVTCAFQNPQSSCPAQSAPNCTAPRARTRAVPDSSAPVWVHTNASADPWPCCGWDGRSSSPCGSTSNEDWTGPLQGFAPAGGMSCYCSPEKRAAVQSWEWQHADIGRFNATHFCELLKRNTPGSLLMFGDSTGAQFAASIYNAVVAGGGTCLHLFANVLSDNLMAMPGLGGMNRGPVWLAEAVRRKPAWVLVSTGPHIHRLKDFVTVLRGVKDGFEKSFRNTSTRLIWRTSLGGGCGPRVLSVPPDQEYWKEAELNSHTFNYPKVQQFDDVAVEFFKDVPNVSVLDMRAMWMRPDAMVDFPKGNCQHVCLPGPGLSLARMFYHHMLTLPTVRL